MRFCSSHCACAVTGPQLGKTFLNLREELVSTCFVPWIFMIGHEYPWIKIVWLDGQTNSRYPKHGIFSHDLGYRGHQKKKRRTTIAWHEACSRGSNNQWVHATVKRFYLLNHLSNLWYDYIVISVLIKSIK